MAEASPKTLDLNNLSQKTFNISNLDDEIRVDRLCVDLLRTFFNALTQQPGQKPEEVGNLCRGADYFLREFIIADRRENLLEVTGRQVRQFAGHWYIVKNLEPNMNELGSILGGIAALYPFLAEHALIDKDQADEICTACAERDWYQQRIEDFWAIEGDGFLQWRDEVPL